MATLHGVGKGAEWYGYGQLGQAAFQGVKTATALGKEGISKLGKSITGAQAKEYLKANVGNLAKKAGVSMVKDVDTWVDVGTGVTNFFINGETTGQYNWGELALDTGLAIVGNYVGAFGGEYLEGAIENAGKVGRNVDNLLPSTSALDADTPKFTVLDGNGHPVTTDIILASGIDTNNMVPDGKYLFDEDGSIVRVDGLFDQNSPDVDLDDVKIAHQMASDQSVYDVEYSINKYMEKYGVTRAEAFDQIQSIIDEKDFKYMTSNGGARQLLRQYSFDDLQNALNVAKRRDNVDNAAVVNIEYAMNQYMKKYDVSRTQAIHVMDRLIEDQDLYRMTSAGGARNLLGQYSFGELDDALMKIKLADAAAASSFTPSAGAFTGGRPSTFTNKADEFFGNVKSSTGSKYGIDQGLIFDFTYYQDAKGNILSYKQAEELYNAAIEKGNPVPRFKRIGNEEYFKVKDLLRDRYGIDYNSSSALLNALDRTGACTYAGTCNEIFYAFRNHPQLFEDSFGFPMYTTVNGSVIPNYSALLADVYVNANAVENGGKFLFKGADGSYHVRPEILTAKTDGLGRRLIDSDLQTYLTLTKTGKNTDVINRYLNQRGLSFHSRLIVDYGSVPSTSQMDDIIRHISDGQGKGLTYTLDIYDNGIKGINLKSLDPNVPSDTTLRYKGGGHEVFITGMNQEGFLVSSYGNKYLIPFSDLLDSRSQWMLNESAITRLNNNAAKELSRAFGGNNSSIRSAADGIDDMFRSGDNIDDALKVAGDTSSRPINAATSTPHSLSSAERSAYNLSGTSGEEAINGAVLKNNKIGTGDRIKYDHSSGKYFRYDSSGNKFEIPAEAMANPHDYTARVRKTGTVYEDTVTGVKIDTSEKMQVTPQRTNHILHGDSSGGGHSYSHYQSKVANGEIRITSETVNPNGTVTITWRNLDANGWDIGTEGSKTVFPKSWGDKEIMDSLNNFLDSSNKPDPYSFQTYGKKIGFLYEPEPGLKVKVVVAADTGDVITYFPFAGDSAILDEINKPDKFNIFNIFGLK
jgi:hypothetical protein